MLSIGTINRLLATSGDFDITGLQIIGYYLRLYAIELLLGEKERSMELTELATELLTTVESYRDSVKPTDASELGNPVFELIHNQDKAKMYLSNFALSLYNGKLKQIREGPWDYTLQRGLWCCIDLFSCISHLWGDEDGSVKKRLKFCKVYLSKLVKGELGHEEEAEIPAEHLVKSPEKSARADLDDQDFPDDVSEESVSELVSRLRAADSDDNEDSASAHISLPDIPKNDPEISPSSETSNAAEPDFIDSDEASDLHESAPPVAESHNRYTKDQLNTMLERSDQIEKVQRMAKYAISALNYDDIATAKDELTKALGILDSL